MSFAHPFRLQLPRFLLTGPVFGSLLLGCGLLAIGFAQTSKEPAPAAPPPRGRVLLVTRHCEKDPAADARDPGLSDSGKARAQALRMLLAPQTIDATFASEYKRAQETALLAIGRVSPGSKEERLPQTIKASEPERLFAAIDALQPGQTALVVGHSNTAPAVLAHYGLVLHDSRGKEITNLREDDYGSLFVVTLPPEGSGAAATLLELHYGN